MTTSSPFVFGTVTDTGNFVNRKEDIQRLSNNFLSGINTVLVSPRRWGKSSLVARTAKLLEKNKSLVVCKIDLFNVRTEEEMYLALSNEVVRQTTSKIEEAVQYAKTFLSQLLPQINISSGSDTPLSFGLNWKVLKKNANDILDLAENIAKKKGIKIVVCIDEFQNIATFDKDNAVQKKMRAHFQHHKHVSYCFYGSKRHMLLDVFTNTSMPFYKFGDLMFLEKINTKEWVAFIQRKFKSTDKQINKKDAEDIVLLVENHSYYVQQLALQTWLRTDKQCSNEIVREAHYSLMQQLSLLFVNLTEGLSNMQLGFLKALLSGEEHLSSREVLDTYKISSSANVSRLKNALLQKDIIDIIGKQINFHDPIYKYWLRTEYFKMPPEF